MLVGGMVHNQIDQHTNAALFCTVSKLDEIAESAVARINVVIVGDVVTVVPARRSLKRHEPNRGYPQSMQIIEAAQYSREIDGSIGVGIHVSTDRQAVDHRVFVPKIVDHMRQ